MLKREDAQKLLEQERMKDWQKQAAADIAGQLPADLRSIAYGLLHHDPSGNPLPQQTWQDNQRNQAIIHQAFVSLVALDPSRRSAVLTALLPGIAPHFETVWALLGRLPYQAGHQRKAFRLRQAETAASGAQERWLLQIVNQLGDYRHKDVTWLAAWAPYLHHGYLGHPLGILFAATIDAGGPEGEVIFEILTASARGEHPTGAMGRHVTTGLLVASRPEGWAFVERLLLAAQREEGLRQVILETIDEAHPEAFRRMLRLILDHDLIRFSATIRAADVWFGFGWAVDNARSSRDTLAEVLDLLTNLEARGRALALTAIETDGSAAPAAPATAGRAARTRAREEEALAAVRASQRLYLALWSVAFEDAESAVDAAGPALLDPNPLHRLAAAHLLRQLHLPRARAALMPLLEDPDLRVALTAFAALNPAGGDQITDLFERFETLLSRLTDKTPSLESGLWPWLNLDARPESVADALVRHLGTRSPTLLIPYLALMSADTRIGAARLLAALPVWETQVLDTFFTLAADRSSCVRDAALVSIGKRPISPEVAAPLEGLLKRKSSETRRTLLTMLLQQSDERALTSASRLLAARDLLQRQAGLNLLCELARAGRAIQRCCAAARAHQSVHATLLPEEQILITAILATGQPAQTVPTLANVLGLIDPAACTPPVPPRRVPVRVDTPAARACLGALDVLLDQHRTTPVVITGWSGSDERLLGNVHSLPQPDAGLTPREDVANLPLAEVWLEWERARPAGMRDGDGLELYRAIILLSGSRAAQESGTQAWLRKGRFGLAGLANTLVESMDNGQESEPVTPADQYQKHLRQQMISSVLTWLVRLQEQVPQGLTDFLLDTAETAMALIPRQALEDQAAALKKNEWNYQPDPRIDGSFSFLQRHLDWHPGAWTDAHHSRHWLLLHWLDQPVADLPRYLPPLAVVLRAHQAGAATKADILAHLASFATGRHLHHGSTSAHDFSRLTARKPPPLLARYPVLQRLVPALRDRILEVELARGEMPTPASPLARSLQYAGGSQIFVRLLAALASSDLVRGNQYDGENRANVFSHLLRTTYPALDDSYEAFTQQVAAARIEAKPLVAAAVYAPQWARYVEHTLGWPGLEDAIWWTHAHTRDTRWSVDQTLRETWNAQVSERTPLSSQDLLDGAVDVAWFWRTYQPLGAERWEQVYTAAKYASQGLGHARARLFADAMLGKISDADLQQRIAATRHQDAVRALGLLPLPAGPTSRDAVVTARYRVIQEFLRTGKQFGAQRRDSEELAARIGLENLARSAGYADPIRLQWAMEASLSADLRDGSLSVEEEGVRMTLSLHPITAEPEMVISRNGTPLQAVPAKLKKNEAIVALQERKREIERQISRMRISLENAMCRGDHFTASEIAGLLDHPVLARLLRNLIFVRDDSNSAEPLQVLGYPVLVPDQPASSIAAPNASMQAAGEVSRQSHRGTHSLQFQAHSGSEHKIESNEPILRLAHPHDLFITGEWHAWQHDCFATERIQPFKQVFRELYVLTQNELRQGDEATSSRYTGHQVQPRQALALFGQRGWISSREEGVSRVFHQESLTAHVDSVDGIFTPAEVEGLTIDRLFFTKRDTWKPVPLKEVPPRIFSEVMRDLDLVVSVAHRGGVDPEATVSTVEMRAALVRETCALLDIHNVAIKSAHTLIEGTLGSYSVHLGSAVVHRQPGGALCIVPVHSQHRGRLFLPFVDDDPRTAEVVSKVVLLARDNEIKDPSILEQIL